MKNITKNTKSKITIIIFLFAIIFLVAFYGYSADNSPQKQKQTTISTQPEKVTTPGEFKVKATYKLTHKNYLVTLKEYGRYNPELGFGFFSVKIEWLTSRELLYYEFGSSMHPYGKKPMAVFEQKDGSPLLFIDMFLDDDRNPDMLKIYDLDNPYNHISLRLGSGGIEYLNDIVGDFDNDGYIEVLTRELKVAGTGEDMGRGAEVGVFSVYRYMPGGGTGGQYYPSPFPYFKRVKGQAFERFFLKQAKNIYKWIEHDFKKKEYELIEMLQFNWLATIESTQNPKLIKEALSRFKSMPYPDKKRKDEMILLLIKDGYPMLSENVPKVR
ncbi:MAG: hypothetical protein NTX75_02640 [Proteobacteria bacterium]|nr:hypothetical protein [Pseudomonadota bacterium]